MVHFKGAGEAAPNLTIQVGFWDKNVQLNYPQIYTFEMEEKIRLQIK